MKATVLVTMNRYVCVALIQLVAALVSPTGAFADDDVPKDGQKDIHYVHEVTWTDANQQTHTHAGRILIEAQDGGIVLMTDDARLWNITADQIRQQHKTDRIFQPASIEKLSQQLQQEFGEGFEIIATRHYVICTNAGPHYAKWCGALFERLMNGFEVHWKSRELTLHEPAFPLIAIVFANQQQFAKFATTDAGPQAADAKGYYSIPTNRMVLYDLTAGPNSAPASSTADVNRKIAASPFNVATVVHEATHQIAFNCGMHTRYADNPLWLTEGMAMYFETPDLRSRSGWRTIGKVNPLRLRRFAEFANSRRSPDSLSTLLASDARLTDAETAADAYAEAWALTYFLIKTRRTQYLDYLNRIAGKPQLVWDQPEKRLAEFQAAFGEDLNELDADFLRYLRRASRR